MNPLELAVTTFLSWASSAFPTFLDISGWMVGGAIFLLAGWIGLSAARAGPRARRAPRAGATLGRVALGGALGALAGVLGAVLLLVGLQPSIPELLTALNGTLRSPWAIVPPLAVGGLAGWLSTSSRWTWSGVSTWLGLSVLTLGFVGYGLLVVREAGGAFALLVGSILVVLETFGLGLMLAYQFYALEFVAGTQPDRAPAPAELGSEPPRVAIQVPSFNEPVGVVEESLDSLIGLDYPRNRRIIQLLDDSTDPVTSEELARFCALRGIEYHHRTSRRGFKAGALNDGLKTLPPDVELLAIVDSDYVVAPTFLRALVGEFRDPQIAFVQTPQAYRNASASRFARNYALADAYFYHVVQPVRARQQSAIFCGTMGLVRRRALEEVGGWSEDCVTEDAELSVRLLTAGWRLAYRRETYGQGLAPLSMAGVRSQHRRWAYGGIQLLGMNRRRLRSSRVTPRQRRDFWVGGMFWTDGIFFLGMAATLSAVAVGSWFGWALPSPAATALAFAAAAPVLLLWDGLFKIRLALRRTLTIGFRDVLAVLGFWYAVKINDLKAALRGVVGERLSFVRTPKVASPRPSRGEAFRSALRATAGETALSVAILSVAGVSVWRWTTVGSAIQALALASLTGWLMYYAWGLAMAPAADYASRRRPAEMPAAASACIATPRPEDSGS